MQITRTHNGYHLGDNLVHLNFLRKVALANPDRQFIHAAQWQYLKQLQDLVEDIPNLNLTDYNYRTPSDSIDAWRGTDGYWYGHPDRNDFVKFHIEAWFPYLSDRMNVENPMRSPTDMLFDYPAIKERTRRLHYYMFGDPETFDVLIINSPPSSGQFRNYNEGQLYDIERSLYPNRIIKTWPITEEEIEKGIGFRTVTEIGHLSLHCHTILMVSTGPSWPTFNIWNQESIRHRIILLEPERVNLSPNTTHCATVDEAAEVLKGIGIL